MNEKKLKELVLFLIAVILIIFLIKYLNVFKYLKLLFNIVIPLIIGFIYAWFINPLIRKLSIRGNRCLFCILFFIIFLFIIGLFLYFLIPIIYQELKELLNVLPEMFSSLELQMDSMGLIKYLDKFISFLLQALPSGVLAFVKGIFKYIGIIFIGLILGLYISFDYDKMLRNMFRIIPKKANVLELILQISDEVRKCVNGTLLVAFFVLIMSTISFWVIGLEAPLLFGILCGLTDLIPYIGPYIGGCVAVLVGFTESNFMGIVTIIICFVIQCVENYVLQPIVMSKSIKISPILVITGLLVFGKLFGLVGLIISTPLIAMFKVIFEYYFQYKNKLFIK